MCGFWSGLEKFWGPLVSWKNLRGFLRIVFEVMSKSLEDALCFVFEVLIQKNLWNSLCLVFEVDLKNLGSYLWIVFEVTWKSLGAKYVLFLK